MDIDSSTSTGKTDLPSNSIQYDDLEDHIQCMICFLPMKRSVLTRCGHRYCYDCLSKSLELNSSCPSCRRELDPDEFYDDYQFNSLVEKLLSHRESLEGDSAMDSIKEKAKEKADKEKEKKGNQEEIRPERKLQDFFDVFIRKEYILIFALGYTDWFLSLSVGLMTYASINAIQGNVRDVDLKFLRIWSVYGVFRTVLVLFDTFFYWLPLFWSIKSILQTVFLALCFVPMSWNGTRIVYNKVISPCFLNRQGAIDKILTGIRRLARGVINMAAYQLHDLKKVDVFPACVTYFVLGLGAPFLGSFVCYACPAYMAFKAIESKDKKEQTRCHVYCVVYSILGFLTVLTDLCLYWIPFYWHIKLTVALVCSLPTKWNGCKFYNDCILSWFGIVKKCQDSIWPQLQIMTFRRRTHTD